MSIKTKLIIPLVLVGCMIMIIIYTWETALNDINSYQSDSEIAANYFQNVLATRVQLDQYILSNKNEDRDDYRESTRALLAETDTLGREFQESKELVNEISDLVNQFIIDLDNYLIYDLGVDSTLELINQATDALSDEILKVSEQIDIQDSIYIYTDDIPDYFSDYRRAKRQTVFLLEEIVHLRSAIRELILLGNTSELDTVLSETQSIVRSILDNENNQYLNMIDTDAFLEILNSINIASKDFQQTSEEFDEQTRKLDQTQARIEDKTIQLVGLTSAKLDQIILSQRIESFIIYGMAIIIFVIMTIQLIRVFTAPLNKIKNAIKMVTNGDDIKDLNHTSSDEFGDIFNTLKEMNNEIRKKETQLIHTNNQLEQSNHELEAFAYSVSHDLRTPLRSISGFSQALLTNQLDQLDETGKDYLNRVAKAAQKMGFLIDDILKLSRISRTNLVREKINVNKMVQEIYDDLVYNTPSSSSHPKLTFNKQITIYADNKMMYICFENLISNAIKFTSKKDHSVIVIDTIYRDGLEFITLSDNGVGFNMKYVDKLFRPFQRLHPDSEYEGTGIGLATVNRIIRKHGGEIFVESEIDKGTTFYINTGGTIK